MSPDDNARGAEMPELQDAASTRSPGPVPSDGTAYGLESESSGPWHFEAPLDRVAFRLRAAIGFGAAAALVLLASESTHRGAYGGTAVGLAAAIVFGILAHASWRVARVAAPPLVLDERGLAFENGIEPRAFVPWEDIEEVELRGLVFARRVVLTTRVPEDREVLIPAICHAGSPPEWTAGLIETFRQHALHRC